MENELPIEKKRSKTVPVLIMGLGVVLIAVGVFVFWKTSRKSGAVADVAVNSIPNQSDALTISTINTSTTSALELAKTNEEKSMVHYNAGVAYYNNGKLDLAESEQLAAIKLSQSSPRPYAALSAIYLGRSNFEVALSYAQDAINIGSTTYPWGYNNKGIALMSLGRSAEAITAFEKAVSISPDTAVFKDNLTRARGKASSTKK